MKFNQSSQLEIPIVHRAYFLEVMPVIQFSLDSYDIEPLKEILCSDLLLSLHSFSSNVVKT